METLTKDLKLWYLYCLSEELGEIQQAIGKGRRYGWYDKGPKEKHDNIMNLKMEIHDVVAVYELLSGKTLDIPSIATMIGPDGQCRLPALEFSLSSINCRIHELGGYLESYIWSVLTETEQDALAFYKEEWSSIIDSEVMNVLLAYSVFIWALDPDQELKVGLTDRTLITEKQQNLAKWLKYADVNGHYKAGKKYTFEEIPKSVETAEEFCQWIHRDEG